MTDLEREELLSAYLDDELSPEERTRVEGWLAESPELRQLQDELLALRAGLQALPRHKLDHDLAGRVLDRTVPVDKKPQDASQRTIIPGSMQWWQRGSNVRRLLWPALAAAAALLILVYDANQRPEEQQVAQAPQEPRDQELQAADEAADEAVDAKIGAAGELSSQSLVREEPVPTAPAMSSADSYAQSPAEAPAPAYRRRTAGEVLNQPAAPPASDLAMRGGKASPQAAELRSKAASNGSLYGQRAAGPKSDALPTLICPVSSTYLQSNEFEKLLNKNRVRWERIPVDADQQLSFFKDQGEAAAVDRLQSLDSSAQQSWYFLHTTNEQVNEILSQVPQAAKLAEGNQALPRFTAPRQKLADEAASGVQVLLVAPQPDASGAAGSPKR